MIFYHPKDISPIKKGNSMTRYFVLDHESYYQPQKIWRDIEKYLVIFGRRVISNFQTKRDRWPITSRYNQLKRANSFYSNGTKTEINHASRTERIATTLCVGKNGRNGWQSETQPSSRTRRCVVGVCNASLVGRGNAALRRKIGPRTIDRIPLEANWPSAWPCSFVRSLTCLAINKVR